MVKVIGLDPGKQKDSFAIVAVERNDDKFLIRNCIRFLGKDYLKVEEEIDKLHRMFGYDYYLLEVNNTGQHVYEVLVSKYNIPVIPVTTTKDIKDQNKVHDYKLMDKNEMVRYMIHLFQERKILFPKNDNQETLELKRQLSIFSEVKTESGTVSYRAEGTEHDDLVMALMLALHYFRQGSLTILKV